MKKARKNNPPSPADLRMERDDRIKKVNPSYEKEQEDLASQLESDLMSEYWKLTDKLPHDALWQPLLNKDGEVTVLFNESHPGYAALFYEDDEDIYRRNLNIFFWTLATYEAHFSRLSKRLDEEQKEELRKQLEAYRKYVSKEFREF